MSEVRITSASGGEKGQKEDRQDLIAVPFLRQLGLICGYGCRKYDAENWRKGYSWRLSYGALQRHLQAFWTGEELDPESGLPHIVHAAWHCMTLFTFSNDEQYAEYDDRQDVGATLYQVMDALQSQWDDTPDPQPPVVQLRGEVPEPPEIEDPSQVPLDMNPFQGLYL